MLKIEMMIRDKINQQKRKQKAGASIQKSNTGDFGQQGKPRGEIVYSWWTFFNAHKSEKELKFWCMIKKVFFIQISITFMSWGEYNFEFTFINFEKKREKKITDGVFNKRIIYVCFFIILRREEKRREEKRREEKI